MTGTFTSASTATLDLTLASSGHGAVQVTGKTTFGGALALTPANGYVPALGTKEVVITSGSQTGRFASVTGRAISTTETAWDVSTKSPHVTLTVTNQADVAAAISAPTEAVVGVPFGVTLTVTNNGPESATKSTVTLSLPPGTTVSGSLPAGCTQATPTSIKCSAGTLANGVDDVFALSVDRPPRGQWS